MQASFLTILGLIFIVLKLTGVIAWSWLWVLAPFWIGFVLIGVAFVCILLVHLATERTTRYH